MSRKINHNDYNKIQDDVYYFTTKWHMKFCVELNVKDTDDRIRNYVSEYGYNNKNGFAITINRRYVYYLMIESSERDSSGLRYQLRIYQDDMYFFLHKLDIVEKWFTGDQDVFAKKDGHIIIPVRQYSERVNFRYGYISMEPTVFTDRDGYERIGVIFYVNSEVMSFMVPVEKFLGFLYFIRNFNMSLSAMTMLNYIGSHYVPYNYQNINGNIEHERQQRNSPNKLYFKEGFLSSTGAEERKKKVMCRIVE